jgi:large subunit ribosomal protein L9
MKVVYLKNSKNIKRGDVKEVADGYFTNYLSPEGLAASATEENIAKIKKELANKDKQKSVSISRSSTIAERIIGRKITVKGKANPAGKLYASITESDVKTAAKKLGFDLGSVKIVFGQHLKEVGDYETTVDFGAGIQSKIIVQVRV